MNGRVKLGDWYFDSERYAGKEPGVFDWSEASINRSIGEAKAGTLEGTYRRAETACLSKKIAVHWNDTDLSVRGKHIVVMGSQIPWVEALLLARGAAHVNTIDSGHPQVATYLPHDAAQLFLSGQLVFDGASFSSIEYSGLGRYGDVLNPWGDLISLAKLWCMVKPGGPFFFPARNTPQDDVQWNAGRGYAPTF